EPTRETLTREALERWGEMTATETRQVVAAAMERWAPGCGVTSRASSTLQRKRGAPPEVLAAKQAIIVALREILPALPQAGNVELADALRARGLPLPPSGLSHRHPSQV